MAYSTNVQVGEKLKVLQITETSDPNLTEVTNIIDEVDAEMDARMVAVGVTVPVTEATKLPYLRRLSIAGTKAEILESLGIDADEALVQRNIFEAGMQQITDNPDIVRVVLATEAAPGRNTNVTRADPIAFRRGEKDW